MEPEKTPQNPAGSGRPPTPANGESEESIESAPIYRKGKIVIPLLLVVIGIAVATWYWYLGRDFASTDDAFLDTDRLTISTKMPGRISELTAGEGDSVQSGRMLVRLDTSDLAAQRLQAVAAIKLAQENVTLSKVAIDRAEEDLQRVEQQFKDKVVPKENYDHGVKDLEAARVRYDVAVAQVGTAEAQLGIIESQLENTVVSSPMDGVIAKRWALPGEVVQPGQPILSMFNLKELHVTANFEETKLSVIHLGDPVEIKIDAYPTIVFKGKVSQLGSNTSAQFSLIPPNNAAGNFTKVTQRVPVKISVEKPGAGYPAGVNLLPGMSVEVRVKVR